MKATKTELAVIGGGAAGMFAAVVASGYGVNITLFERNEYLGRKLGITGKGRCNITNNGSVSKMIENIPGDGRFLYSALNAFSPSDTIEYFKSLGVKLKTERGGRVFPESDKASEVVNALRKAISSGGVSTINERVLSVFPNDEGFSVKTNLRQVDAKAVIIATGGLSYPRTGSTGDGYKFAESNGHTITQLRPSLVPLVTESNICSRMQGLALKNVRMTVIDASGKELFSDLGELLFTHFGLSGPLVLSASAHMRNFKDNKYCVKIDLKPALDEKKLDLRLLRDFEKFSNRDFENSLSELLPRKMIPVIVELSGIAGTTKVNSITREQRKALLTLLKDFRINITGPRSIDEAIITAGGVSLKEVNPATMESKIVPGLYFAGEILDLDAYTGGYNLQIAWSTAHAAATAAAKKIIKSESEVVKMKYRSIAIDGPSGAGKSTLAKMLASELGFVYVDTGAIYRSVGLYTLNKGVDPNDKSGVIALLPEISIEIAYDNTGLQRMFLNDEDVTSKIRTPEVSKYASAVSAIPDVRGFLLNLQREFSEKYNVIMDGRDIGTVVLPNADLKIFLTADLSARAYRRYLELVEKGIETTLDDVKADMEIRDRNDSSRETAPLRQADDAILVDTSEFTLDESFAKLRSIVKESLGL